MWQLEFSQSLRKLVNEAKRFCRKITTKIIVIEKIEI